METIKLLEVIKEPSANQYLTFPYKIGEKVRYMGEYNDPEQPRSFNRQFIIIYRFKEKKQETISRSYFKRLGKWEFDGQIKKKIK